MEIELIFHPHQLISSRIMENDSATTFIEHISRSLRIYPISPYHITTMAVQNPIMETHNSKILELDPDNVIKWIMAIQCEDDTLQISSQIEDEN